MQALRALLFAWSCKAHGWTRFAEMRLSWRDAISPAWLLLVLGAGILVVSECWPAVAYRLFPPTPQTDLPPQLIDFMTPVVPKVQLNGVGIALAFYASILLVVSGATSLAVSCTSGRSDAKRSFVLAAAATGPGWLLWCALELLPVDLHFNDIVVLPVAFGIWVLAQGMMALHGIRRWLAFCAALLVAVALALYVGLWWWMLVQAWQRSLLRAH